MSLRRCAVFVLAAFALAVGAGSVRAQHKHAGVSPEKLGEVHFAVSCSPLVKERFERAVNGAGLAAEVAGNPT